MLLVGKLSVESVLNPPVWDRSVSYTVTLLYLSPLGKKTTYKAKKVPPACYPSVEHSPWFLSDTCSTRTKRLLEGRAVFFWKSLNKPGIFVHFSKQNQSWNKLPACFCCGRFCWIILALLNEEMVSVSTNVKPRFVFPAANHSCQNVAGRVSRLSTTILQHTVKLELKAKPQLHLVPFTKRVWLHILTCWTGCLWFCQLVYFYITSLDV